MKKPIWLSPHLPDDIVSDILTRVPVKSLLRFRCVSKSWYSSMANPIFITAHLNLNQAINNHNLGYLLYESEQSRELCTLICNNDYTLTYISRFQIPFFTFVIIVGYCNGIFCIRHNYEVYLWNPSIRKLKIISTTRFTMPLPKSTLGLAYHSQNNDFKVLRIANYMSVHPPPMAEVYTLSTDSWRQVEIPIQSLNEPGLNGCFSYRFSSTCLFFHGALHSIAESADLKFILAFDVNDEIFREIMLPQNYLDGVDTCYFYEHLTVFKGSLAFFAYSRALEEGDDEYQISVLWVMREYGVVESWTKINGPMSWVKSFYGCTNNGELLIETPDDLLVSFDPESLNKNAFGIPNTLFEDRFSDSEWMDYTTNFVESLVLVDGIEASSFTTSSSKSEALLPGKPIDVRML